MQLVKNVHRDNFGSKAWEMIGIKTRMTPLHPQSEHILETFNKTMDEHLVDSHQPD